MMIIAIAIIPMKIHGFSIVVTLGFNGVSEPLFGV
jgi:hypothetical protein